MCGRGGTGRRATLRSLWAKARGSSSLLDRTILSEIDMDFAFGHLLRSMVSCSCRIGPSNNSRLRSSAHVRAMRCLENGRPGGAADAIRFRFFRKRLAELAGRCSCSCSAVESWAGRRAPWRRAPSRFMSAADGLPEGCGGIWPRLTTIHRASGRDGPFICGIRARGSPPLLTGRAHRSRSLRRRSRSARARPCRRGWRPSSTN